MKNKEQQIKDKSRVSNFGEVLTSKREVLDMLNLVNTETTRLDSRFLEPACGDGNFLIEVLNLKLNSLKKNYSKNNIRFINDDVFNFLKENVENFDSVVCSHLIEHMDEPELFLKKISEYTNLVFIEVPDNESNYLNLIRKDQNISLNYSDDDHIYEFEIESLKKIFTRCNFKVEHEEYKFGIMRFWIKKNI